MPVSLPSIFRPLLTRLTDFMIRPHYPPHVLEIGQDRCVAASVTAKNGRILIRGAEMEELPTGVVEPHFSQKNIEKEEVISDSCRRVLSAAGIPPGPVTLLIPEGCVKVTIIDDFESLPGEAQHVRELILHKLKRVLPFPITEAALSWKILHRSPKPLVITLVIHTGILSQYDGIVRNLGCQAGCIDIPTFNLLPLLGPEGRGPDAASSVLIVSQDRTYLSQILMTGGEPILFRTKVRNLGVEPEETRFQMVVEEVLATARYYEDKVSSGQPVGAILLRETTGQMNALRERISSMVTSPVTLMGPPDIATARGEPLSPVTAQILLPLIGAALR